MSDPRLTPAELARITINTDIEYRAGRLGRDAVTINKLLVHIATLTEELAVSMRLLEKTAHLYEDDSATFRAKLDDQQAEP